jgi:hypothetical protein
MRRSLCLIFMITIVWLVRPATADAVPAVTRDFLTLCKANINKCYDEIAVKVVVEGVAGPKTFCVPRSVLASEATYTASHRRVIKWMTDHPESQSQPTRSSIKAALRALYPCH